MMQMNIRLDGDGCWPDLEKLEREGKVIQVGNDGVIGVAALEDGMTSGRTSVALRIDLPDGRVVFAETSLRLFLTAADALRARYGEE